MSTFLLLGSVFVAVASGCGSSLVVETASPGEEVDEGSWYSRQEWPHDGNPYASTNFVVFSDRAGQQARAQVADVAEGIWAELLEELSVQPEMLRFPEGQDKVHIYAYRDYYPQEWGMRAYFGGLIMWSPDHESRPTDVGSYAPVVRHELVHVVESLLKGRDGGAAEMTDVWFSEGLAEALSGGTAGGAIRDLDRLHGLVDQYGERSPVWFKRDSQVAGSGAGFYFNYPMYQLAVEYLLDEDGLGATRLDVRDLFLDMADGASFQDAFEAHIPIGLDDYEREFFARIDGFLPQYRSFAFSPAGFMLLSLLVAGAVATTLAVGQRQWRNEVAGGGTGTSRGAPIAFRSVLGLATIIVIAFFLRVLYVVGTAHNLNNSMDSDRRTTAYWVLAGYLMAATGILLWALRRWLRRSKSAFLVAPLIMATTVAVFVAIATLV